MRTKYIYMMGKNIQIKDSVHISYWLIYVNLCNLNRKRSTNKKSLYFHKKKKNMENQNRVLEKNYDYELPILHRKILSNLGVFFMMF